MLNKALLLASQKKNANTTGRFTITNGVALGELNPDFPEEQATFYGFILGRMGGISPVVEFYGCPVEALYYESNMMMGDRAMMELDISALGEWPDDTPQLKLINHTSEETFDLYYIGYDGRFRTDVPIECFTPVGSETVWEITVP